MTDQHSNETVRAWQQNATYWAEYSETIRLMFAPVTRALVEQANIREGQKVLDVAGGTGEPALTIARHVGASGSVMCTDAVLEMQEAAKDNAWQLKVTNVEFRHCPAESLPFANDSFDVAESRLGVMLFADPLGAVKEMLRVVKPGGTVAFVVWHRSELNPFCSAPSDVMTRHITSPPSDPEAAGAFRFAAPGKLAQILSEAGAVNVNELVFEFRIEAPISPAEYWELRSVTSGTLREQLATLSTSEVQKIRTEVEESVREFFQDDQMSFPASMIIVTGRKA